MLHERRSMYQPYEAKATAACSNDSMNLSWPLPSISTDKWAFYKSTLIILLPLEAVGGEREEEEG